MKSTTEEIKNYWGSLEAYSEEQRRINLHALEAEQRDGKLIQPAKKRFAKKRASYPVKYVKPWTFASGKQVTIRPIRPSDEGLMVKFHETLSDRSVYFRWFTPLGLSQRISPERLKRVCSPDYTQEMALVADYQHPQTGKHQILGVGRLTKVANTNEAELSVIICDEYQGQGLGTELINRLVQFGQDRKFDRIIGDVHPENIGMKKLCQNLGFKVHYSQEDEVTKIAMELAA